MANLAFLVVDDKPEWSGALADALKRIRDSTVAECGKVDRALARAQADYFDGYFVDLVLRDFESASQVVYEGVALIEQLRQHAPNSVIIGYSASIEQGGEDSNRIAEECRAAGADVVMARTTLLSMASSKLAAAIQGWLAERAKTLPADRLLVITDDIATRGAVEVIGERTLRLLLADLLADSGEDEVKGLSAGFSGAYVLAVKSRMRAPGGSLAQNVLKLSRSEFGLDSELIRRPVVGSHLEALAVSSMPRTSKRVDGWRAAIFRKVTGAVPLAHYLQESGTPASVQKTLARLVADVCIGPARDAQPLVGGAAIGGEYRLSWRAGAALTKAFEDLGEMHSVVASRDRAAVARVREYVSALLHGKASLVSGDERFARLHGDLHAENIFVGDDKDPLVIDFERSDAYPRLFDIACLDVDLTLARLDHARGREWEFARIDGWAEWAMASFPFREGSRAATPTSAASRRVHFLRHALLDGMRQEIDGVTANEYGRALLFQLTRYLKFPAITIPKKLVGIRMCVALLKLLKLVSR